MIDQVMKDSSCHNPRMEAYYKEVWHLEDKFHGLELNHVARRYNEATDELVKITSSRTMVPPNVFSRDLHKPFIDLRATEGVDSPSLDPQLRQRPPRLGLASCRWKARPYQPISSPTCALRTLTISFEGSSPWTRSRLDGSLVGPRPL
jgi:hypothetical protein